MKRIKILSFSMLSAALGSVSAQNDGDLAKKLANPVSSLISVPFQNNSDYGIGAYRGSRNTMNIQPVVPISVSEDLNLIGRAILPVITQYNIYGQGSRQSGLSDMVLSGFLSPKNSKNGLTWGAGPVLLLPTGTDDLLTAKKIGLGPTAVVLKQSGGWTYGILLNQIWSIAGSSAYSNISQMFAQPFLNYNWSSGAGLGTNLEMTQNWVSDQTMLWLNPTVSGVASLGTQKVSLALGPRFNLASPEGARSDWGWRGVVIFLFPK